MFGLLFLWWLSNIPQENDGQELATPRNDICLVDNVFMSGEW